MKRSGAFKIYDGFLGLIYGWLCCTNMPSDVPNKIAYYSGDYQRYELNMQAVCDANLCITYICVAAPGQANDACAYKRLHGVIRWLERLPKEHIIGGGNAYSMSNNLLIYFSGSQRHVEINMFYNFYFSQLKIRVEMCFGRLTTKWRIFCSNLDLSSQVNSKIICVGIKLHNYVINADNLNFSNVCYYNFNEIRIQALEAE